MTIKVAAKPRRQVKRGMFVGMDPVPPLHGYRDGSDTTLCGRSLVGLHLFADRPYKGPLLGYADCAECTAALPEGS